jgi:hypothetical protein
MKESTTHSQKVKGVFMLNQRIVKALAFGVFLVGLLASTSFAATVATVAVTPSITAAGGKIFIHTAASNQTSNNEAVTVTLKITNPGMCVTGNLPSQAGAFAFGLSAGETRLADLSLDIPAAACSGTYGVTVEVKNASGTVLATHTTKFTVAIPTP